MYMYMYMYMYYMYDVTCADLESEECSVVSHRSLKSFNAEEKPMLAQHGGKVYGLGWVGGGVCE
jgi:hypothetical protein